MNFLRKYANQALFLQIGVLLGFFICQFPSITFSKELDPFEFANIFITLIIAFLITQIIEPSNQNKRVEKDLMIEQLTSVKDFARTINDFFIEVYGRGEVLKVDQKQKFKTLFRSLSIQITLFIDQVDQVESCSLIKKDELKNTFFRYKQAITGGRFEFTDFKYSSHPFSQYETPFGNFIKEVNKLILEVNKK